MYSGFTCSIGSQVALSKIVQYTVLYLDYGRLIYVNPEQEIPFIPALEA